MTPYLLDTHAASAAMRGHAAVDARLQALAPGQWCISAATCSEIRYGAATRPEAVRLHRIAQAFLRIATILPWTPRRRAGTVRCAPSSRRAGSPSATSTR